MSEEQIKKILNDLQNSNDKIVILALMYIPRLSTEICHTNKNLHLLRNTLEDFQNHVSADISFLSAKAKNFLLRNWPELSNYKNNEPSLDQNLNPEKEIIHSSNHNYETRSKKFERPEKDLLGQTDLNELIANLKHQDPRVRSSAIEICSKEMEPEESQKYLIPLMQDENNRVRANAIVALKHLPTEDLCSSLKYMLESPRISMRESAIWALSELKPNKNYLNFLLKALYDPYRDIRIRTIRTLSLYVENSVIAQMKRLLQDPDKEIASAAKNTLELLVEKYVNHSSNPLRETDNSNLAINIDEKSIVMESEYLEIDKATNERSQIEEVTPPSSSRPLNSIHRRIALQQKLDMVEVTQFFNEIKCDEINSTKQGNELYWASPFPNEDILNWIPAGYLPEYYSQTKNNESARASIRQQISELLVLIGKRSFAYQKTCQEPNVDLNELVIKLTELAQKIKLIQVDTGANTNQKAKLKLQLNQISRETLIKLGRATLKQFNLKNIEFEGLREMQLDLNRMVKDLSSLNNYQNH